MPILKQHSKIQFMTALIILMYKRNYDHFSFLGFFLNWCQHKNLVLPCGPSLKYRYVPLKCDVKCREENGSVFTRVY